MDERVNQTAEVLAAERERRLKRFEALEPLTEDEVAFLQDSAERGYGCGDAYAWQLAAEVKRLRKEIHGSRDDHESG